MYVYDVYMHNICLYLPDLEATKITCIPSLLGFGSHRSILAERNHLRETLKIVRNLSERLHYSACGC